MSLRLTITRYDDVLGNPEVTVQWQRTHQGVDSLRALELIRAACRGSLADETTYEIVRESTGRTFTSAQLARVAYFRSTSDVAQRKRFASWFDDVLGEILFPWDDAVPFPVPVEEYWSNAACWTREVLGSRIDDWLSQHVTTAYGVDFAAQLSRHDAEVAAGTPSCWRCRSRRARTALARS